MRLSEKFHKFQQIFITNSLKNGTKSIQKYNDFGSVGLINKNN